MFELIYSKYLDFVNAHFVQSTKCLCEGSIRWCIRVRAAYVVAHVLGSIRRCIRATAYVGAYV